MMRARTLAGLVSLSLLAACSSTWVYNQLDWMVPWYVEDYVDLTREQNRNLKQQLEPLLKWHRKEELAEYLALVERVEADLEQPLTTQIVQVWTDEATIALMRLEQRVLPLAFDVGEQLSDAQMREFLDNLWKRQAELEEEYLDRSDEVYVEESFENFEENMVQFLGRLDAAQKQRLQEAASSMIRFDAAWLADRHAWLESLQSILLERDEDWQQQIRDALATREERQSSEYRSAWLHNQSVINAAVADVLNSRTEKQARQLLDEIADIKRDLAKLIRQAS